MRKESLFSDQARIQKLPATLADKITTMMSEIASNGEETTADETVEVIEAAFSHLGRLWVAEYLQAIEDDIDFIDEALNRSVFEMLSSTAVTMGRWVGIAREIRSHFVQEGRTTVVRGLADQDFGEPGQDEHPVALLIKYRNAFSHGSMAVRVEEIRKHRYLVGALLENLPALTAQPILFATEAPGEFRYANGSFDLAEVTCLDSAPWNPVVLADGDGPQLQLYPLFYTTRKEGVLELKHTSAREKTHPVARLFERNTFRTWLERYLRERNGHLDFAEAVAARSYLDAPPKCLSMINSALSRPENKLILVEGHPGCGKASVLQSLSSLGATSRFADCTVFVVADGELGQSGMTFVSFILRRIERVLGKTEGFYQTGSAPLFELREALSELSASGQQILLGLEDLHKGQTAIWREHLSVLDVYRALAGGAISVVATVHPGSINGPLFFDERISLPPADETSIDVARVATAIDELSRGSPLHSRILEYLVTLKDPQDLFSICDGLESQGGPALFEPKVERALWELRPLLTIHRKDGRKTYAPFSPAVASAIGRQI